jgi:translocator protein
MLSKMNNSTKDWYDHLHKSPLTPPDNVFGIVWPILYTLMLISLILLIINRTRNTPLMIKCYVAFGIQLVFNILWPIIFFGQRQIHWGLVDLILTDIFTIMTIYFFQKVFPISAYLLIPYMLWISFATYLNLYIVIKN